MVYFSFMNYLKGILQIFLKSCLPFPGYIPVSEWLLFNASEKMLGYIMVITS